MKRIVYLSFYFKPDLSAGSFRNSSLAQELASKAKDKNCIIEIYTTYPNRYSSFNQSALTYEEYDNIIINRILIPNHKNGFFDQILSFYKYYKSVICLNKQKSNSLVFASSSRLFTAYLGYKIAKKYNSILYLDIRDIFIDTINDVIKLPILSNILMYFLKKIEFKVFTYAKHINLISFGFKEYFDKFKSKNITYYTNGIDDEFLHLNLNKLNYNNTNKKLIIYAGNIGEGQGLHRIIPQVAKRIEKNYNFLIIGDGGNKNLLKNEIKKLNVNNVIIQDPINRNELIELYNSADFLFLHLNDYNAFKKVLPSKIFELATINKPIIAGVSGYAAKFIQEEVDNSFVFNPCNEEEVVNYLNNYKPHEIYPRLKFIEKFKRSNINSKMSISILEYIK